MFTQTVEQLRLPFFADRDLVVQRHSGQISSDAGLLPIREFDEHWGYTRRMADCLDDDRCVCTHTNLEMLRQRLYGIIADYEDCNDHDSLRDDPVLKIIADRLPDDDPLASQPTLSRFENATLIPALWKLLDFVVQTGIDRLCAHHDGQVPEAVTLDLDPTDDPAHGQQQLVMFHGYYEQHQYFPMIISEPTTRHVFYAHLRPGAVHAALGADDDLVFVVERLRQARSDVSIHVRGDSGFGVPWMYRICEENSLTYTFGIAANRRLQADTTWLVERAAARYEATGQKQRLFTAFSYRAGTWDRYRTIIAKAECHSRGTNLRFVVTNLPLECVDDAERLYDEYIQRGASEQRMDELKNGLHLDRLSCRRFCANFFRLLVHTAAYNLLNALRDHPSVPADLRCAQPAKWRTRLVKVAATITQTTRRIVVQLAAQWPYWDGYRAVCHRASCAPLGP